MGGGLCRPSDVFSASLPLAISTALPINRSFMHDAILTADIDPWLASDVQSFLLPALASSLALPQELRKQQALAQSLFARYHHSHTATLSQPQLAALIHDHLTATAAYAPQLIAAAMVDSHRQLLTLIAHHRATATPLTRDTRRHIEQRTKQAEQRTNQLITQWLHTLRQREGQLTQEVWERLVERGRASGGGGGGVTEAVFVEWWQWVSDEVMAMKQFQLHIPSPLDEEYDSGGEGLDGAEEERKGGVRGRSGVEESERGEESRTVVEVITVEESLRMRHGSVSESHSQ